MANETDYCVENIKRREPFTAMFLALFTFGIYMIYWFVQLTNDSNAIAKQFGTGKVTASGGKAVLFTMFSFGLYYLYWSYQLAKKLDQNALRFLVCSLFCGGVVNYFDAQAQINSICDELERRRAAASSVASPSANDVNPFTGFSRADFAATGLPSEVYDYCVSLKPGDLVLKILCEDDDYTFDLDNGEIKCKFARKNFGLVARTEYGVAQLYFALAPLTEPLKSMAKKIIFKVKKGEDGFSVLESVADENLIQELREESERLKAQLANARKS